MAISTWRMARAVAVAALTVALGGPLPAGPASADDDTAVVTVRVLDDQGRPPSVPCTVHLSEIDNAQDGGWASCRGGPARVRVPKSYYMVYVQVDAPYISGDYVSPDTQVESDDDGYRVRLGTRAHLTGYDGGSPENATLIDATRDVTLPAVTLDTRGWISGTLRDPAGKGVSEIPVEAVTSPTQVQDSDESRKGVYELGGLRTGSYRVAVNREGGKSLYVGGYYAGKGRPLTPTWEDATPVTVTEGRITSGIDVELSTCATLTGTITADPRNVAQVTVFNDADDSLVTRWTDEISDSGRFTVTGLLPGSYYLAVGYGDWSGPVFHGSDSTHRPTRPTLTVPSCTDVTGVVVDPDRYLTMRVGPWVTGGDATDSDEIDSEKTASVGQELVGERGTWTGKNLRFSYRWLRGAQTIPGATGTTYTLTQADIGHSVSFEVTATAFSPTAAFSFSVSAESPEKIAAVG